MKINHTLLAGSVLSMLLGAAMAQADSLTQYGGVGLNVGTDYPFAFDYDDGTAVEADYGMAGVLGFVYTKDQGLFNKPLELAVEAGVLVGDDSHGHDLISDCSGGVSTYLGLISDCQDRADVENLTYWLDASAMIDFGAAGGNTDLLAGLGVLHFANKLDADYLYPLGYENFVDRDTSFTGAGLKMGARHRIAMQNGMTLNLAGFAGAYYGERKLEISDSETYLGTPGSDVRLTEKSNETVYSLELRPSISMAADWAGADATMEFGVSYKHFFNVVDETGYGDHSGDDAGGDFDGDVSALTAFFGVTIPM
ncbi:hypothetical protein [Celeribacter sp. SCSIO 80788]|uniref:hypothetical protein n=1 Tax=Celeribacter sp. SCSIO 80788 TaxID=3117013 RepID=UPI003DA2948D